MGPAIASGSQVCSGTWADLPATPASSSRAMRVGWASWASEREEVSRMTIVLMRKVPVSEASARIPMTNGTSPSLVTRNALREALRAAAVSQ
ncbi:hypothetical protein GCM10009716_26680 [Streptomyces sodiiphilus]|uniref:Uncharacterized protein n=1 Tax=Streptomyces sodiiphilus TaxID=226217 RepID=A0ABP5AMW1_9ACTN